MKKIVIRILTIIVVIAMLIIGKIQMDKYRVKSIAHSEEAKVAIERVFKNRDDKAFTSEGKIKSYRLNDSKIKKNPMGGIDISIISQDKYNGGYKTEAISISPKLDEIMYSEDKEKK